MRVCAERGWLQVLCHTCVLEFYIQPGPARRLFAFLFKDLETHTGIVQHAAVLVWLLMWVLCLYDFAEKTQEMVENLSKQNAGVSVGKGSEERLSASQVHALKNRLQHFLNAASRNFASREDPTETPNALALQG